MHNQQLNAVHGAAETFLPEITLELNPLFCCNNQEKPRVNSEEEEEEDKIVSLIEDKSQPFVRIEVSDGIVEVDRESALLSSAVHKLLSLSSQTEQTLSMDLQNIRKRAVAKVFKWCKYVLVFYFTFRFRANSIL